MTASVTRVASDTAAPPRQKERLVVVDAVRALALLGVLVMNLRSMSGLEFLSAPALQALQSPVDRALDVALRVLVDDKALSAFSFLFGLSFTLLLDSAAARRGSFLAIYARRLVVLAAFGLVNVAFLYWADILITYAVLGGLLLLAVRLPQRVVLALSAILLLGVPAALAASGAVRGPDVQTAADVQALTAFGSPSFAAAVEQGLERYFGAVGTNSAIGNWDLTNIFGLFLLGLWTGRRRIPHDLGGNRRLLHTVAAIGLPVGLGASLAWVLLPPGSPLATLMLFGVPVLAMGYLAAGALALDAPAARPVRELLASAGRLALTNYLAYGLIGQIVFYGWALDLIGTFGTAEVVLVSLIAYLLLLAASHAWLMPFRIGPAEWLWRSLTYLSLQPLRRSSKTGPIEGHRQR